MLQVGQVGDSAKAVTPLPHQLLTVAVETKACSHLDNVDQQTLYGKRKAFKATLAMFSYV
jgi:hypothetical protein